MAGFAQSVPASYTPLPPALYPVEWGVDSQVGWLVIILECLNIHTLLCAVSHSQKVTAVLWNLRVSLGVSSLIPSWCRSWCQHDTARRLYQLDWCLNMCAFLCICFYDFPCANHRVWNVFVSFGVWLHLLSVCLTGGFTRKWNYVCGFGKDWTCFLFFFMKLVFKTEYYSLIVRLFSQHKEVLYNRTMHSAATYTLFKSASSGFPPLCFNVYLPIFERWSTLMFPNVFMRLLFSTQLC